MAQLLSNDGSLKAKDNAGSLKKIFEHIVNFFTFGCMQNKRAKQYEAFAENMGDELYKKVLYGEDWTNMDNLSFEYSGCEIKFTPPGKNLVDAHRRQPVKCQLKRSPSERGYPGKCQSSKCIVKGS